MTVLRSEEIAEIAGALAKAQGEMLVPAKKRTATVQMRAEKGGGSYTYKYADLSDIREAVTPALSKNGLAVAQLIDAETCRLTTMVLHSSGQFIGSTYDLPRGLSAQAFGSALTYAKRYSLCSILGVVAEEDDDAQMAQPFTQRQAKNAKTGLIAKPKVTPVVNGTSGPNLPMPPKDLTREDIMQRITETYKPLMVLDKNLDLAAHIYATYGAQHRKDLRDEEAWDLLQFMTNKLRNGVAQ